MTATSFHPVAADAKAGWLAISVLGPRTTLCLVPDGASLSRMKKRLAWSSASLTGGYSPPSCHSFHRRPPAWRHD
jgi:hypothetical protein